MKKLTILALAGILASFAVVGCGPKAEEGDPNNSGAGIEKKQPEGTSAKSGDEAGTTPTPGAEGTTPTGSSAPAGTAGGSAPAGTAGGSAPATTTTGG